MGIKNSENDQKKSILVSNDKFRIYIENAPDGVFVADENGHYLEVNKASERITGYSKAELLSMSINQLFPPEGIEEGIRHFTEVRNTGRASGELEFIHKNGSKRWWLVDAVKLSETRYLGFAKDITEQKQTDKLLRESEYNLREAQHIAHMGRWELNIGSNTLHWSDDIFEIFEIDKKKFEASYEAFLNVVHPDDREMVNDAFKRSLKDKKPYDIEHRILMKDGRIKWVREICRNELDENGNPISSVGIVQENTDSKEVDELLHESNQFNHQIIDSAHEGIIVYGKDLRYKVWNPFMESLIGLKSAEVIGKHPLELFPFLKSEGVMERLDKALKGETPGSVEFPYTYKNRTGWASDTTVPLYNANKEIIGVLATVQDITERKQAEKALKDNEARYSSMISNIGDVIGIMGSDGLMKYKSPNIEKWFGWKPEDLIGKDGWSNVHPDDIDRIQIEFDTLIKQEKTSTTLEYRYKCKWGNYKWIELTAANCINDPTINGVLLNYHDITKRKQAEELLRNSENRFKTAFYTSPDAVNINRIEDGLYIDINEGFTSLTGYTRKDVIGRTSGEINIWHNSADRQELVRGLKEKGYYNNLEAKFRTKDGSITTALMSASIIDLDGQAHILSLTRDISKRIQVELALSNEKERLAVTLRSIGDGVITTDTKGNIVMLNKVAEALTGWSSNEAIGHPLPEVFNIINENTRERCENPVEKVLATGSIIELENHTCLIAKDGREIVIADSGAPIRNKESQIIGVVLVFRDMTEKQKLENAFQNSQKLESLGILAGGIANDFNNILGAIFGYTELAMLKTKEEKVSSYLAKLLSNIDRARALTEQLLTFAKGGVPIKNVENLFPFVQETTQFALSGSPVSSRFQIQENLWACDFDRNKIGQVIDNLTINAQQAMPMGGTITVSAMNITLSEKEHITLTAGNYVKLSIKDQGIGIPKEYLTNIFDPYYTTKPNGHGLGLATCYSIINKHDGFIEVESEQGKGSTFQIYLPAAIDPVITIAEKPANEHKGCGTFLVMDDEEVIREIMKELLESFGYTVILKKNGQDAINFFVKEINSKRTLSGMIFDLTIPGGMGGKEAIGEIRKICENTPVFVASGYSGDPVIANPEEYGFNASILKPFRKNELSEMLEKHLKKHTKT